MIITVSFEDKDDIEFKVDEAEGKVSTVYVYEEDSKLIDWIDVTDIRFEHEEKEAAKKGYFNL